MKVLLDINVMLDFLQRREPFFDDAARIIDAVNCAQIHGVLAGHAVTTLHYFLRKGADPRDVLATLRWLVSKFEIVPADANTLAKAIEIPMTDYEDAVTSQCAIDAGCDLIVTRDRHSFDNFQVPTITPAELAQRILVR